MTSGYRSQRPGVFYLAVFLGMLALPAGARELSFADGLVYNDFYAVRVHTAAGESFTLFDAASYPGDAPPWPGETGTERGRPGAPRDKTMFYFFWIRRMGDAGAVTYPVEFRKIREIRFAGPFGGEVDNPPVNGTLRIDKDEMDVRLRMEGPRFSGWTGAGKEPAIPGYTPSVITFTDGKTQSVYLKTDGFLGGIDEEFGSYAMLWLRHDGVDKLEFLHNGTYARCPECGAVYFDERLEDCPFDKARLSGEK